MKISRIYHRAYAFVFAYFWLPCPICGEHFGGHEYDGGNLDIERHRGIVVCPNCKGEAVRRNNELFAYPATPEEQIDTLLGPGEFVTYESPWGFQAKKRVPRRRK